MNKRTRTKQHRWPLIVCGLLFCSGIAAAVSLPPTEHFSKFDEIFSVRISPGGEYLAFMTKVEGRNRVIVYDREKKDAVNQIFFTGSNEEVGEYYWSSNERLVVGIQRFIPSMREQPFVGGELFAVNVNGRKERRIFTFRLPPGKRKSRSPNNGVGFGGWAMMLDPLPDEPNYVLIRTISFSGARSGVYKLHTFNSSMRRIAQLPSGAGEVLLDDEDQVRYAWGMTEYYEQFLAYKAPDSLEWVELLKMPYPGGMLEPVAFTDDGKAILALDNRNGGTKAVVKASLDLKRVEMIYRDPVADVLDIKIDKDGNAYAFVSGIGKPELHYLDPNHERAEVTQSLRATFPDSRVEIVNATSNGSLQVIHVSSDRNPGFYYLFDKKAGGLIPFSGMRPWINQDLSGSVAPIEFKARDGLHITGLLTIPPGQTGEALPLVVNPHGGPHGPFDAWGYDKQSQFLASRGYAVLQVNFRGSGGFGADFEAAGFREWGRKIQHDVIDATRYVIKNFPIDPERVAIMGASFGGYSALQASIIEPDLYKAAIGVVGVYDFNLMYSAGDIRGRFSGRRYLEKALGKDKNEFAEFSPIQRVAELKAPVLLIQGEEDDRAPVVHANKLAAELKRRGHPHEYVVIANEGHGFYKPENRVRHLELMERFLDKYL
jgi:dipeptidyl aminopeptidase/acylaminoacyl peptidase